MANPLKAIFDIKREEVPLSILMFSYFFLVITTFWILKPLKKSLFITFYDQTGVDILAWHMRGSQAELLAKILNMFVAFLAVIVFSWLANKYRRQMLTFIFSGFFIISYIIYRRCRSMDILFIRRSVQHANGGNFFCFHE